MGDECWAVELYMYIYRVVSWNIRFEEHICGGGFDWICTIDASAAIMLFCRDDFVFFPYPHVCCVRGSVLRNRPTVRWLLFLAANRLKVIALLKMMLRSNLWWWSSEVRARSDLGLVWFDRKNICVQLQYYYTQNSLRYTKYFLASFVTSMNPFFSCGQFRIWWLRACWASIYLFSAE